MKVEEIVGDEADVKEDAVRYPRSDSPLSPALLAVTLVAPLLVTACSGSSVESHWTGETVTVDGVMTEADWPAGTTTFDKKKEYLIGFRNDEENLYLVFRFSNGMWARTIRSSGLVLWLGEDGKKSKKLGLRYRGGPMPQARPGQQRDPGQGGRPTGRQGMPPEERDVFALIRADSEEEIELPTGGARGPAVASSLDRGVYTYELRIPLVDESAEGYGIATRPGAPFALGVEVVMDRRGLLGMMPGGGRTGGGGTGGMPPPGGRGGGGGGGGGMGGRGGGQGGMGGGMQGGSQMPTELKLWIKTVLAAGPPAA